MSSTAIIIVLALAVGLFLFLRPVLRVRSIQSFVAQNYPIGAIRGFHGTYVMHWEVPRFEWHARGCRPGWGDGLFCHLEWSSGIPMELKVTDRGPGKTFNLNFRGEIIEKGRFGHMGICSYRVRVEEVTLLEAANN